MITLITGLPGAGKTLYTIQTVEELRQKSGREVFYSGIKNLALPWTEFDAEKWFELPVNAIIVIDECQTIFRPRAHGKNPPQHVAELETHRHEGYDIFLITQHPSLCDVAVRRLSGLHFHVMRAFGMHKAMVHEFVGVNTRCDEATSRETSIKHPWAYPTKLFQAYHSAEVHTHKRRLPMRMLLLVILPVLIAAASYGVYYRLKPENVASQFKGAKDIGGGAVAPTGPGLVPVDAKGKDKNIVELWQPRLPDFPETAPLYDELTTVRSFPQVKACVKSSRACKCYTDQGTAVVVSANRCEHFATNATFDPYREPVRSEPNLPTRPHAPLPVQDVQQAPATLQSAVEYPPSRFGAMGYTANR